MELSDDENRNLARLKDRLQLIKDRTTTVAYGWSTRRMSLRGETPDHGPEEGWQPPVREQDRCRVIARDQDRVLALSVGRDRRDRSRLAPQVMI